MTTAGNALSNGADVVIVGAGIVGASIAYHLTSGGPAHRPTREARPPSRRNPAPFGEHSTPMSTLPDVGGLARVADLGSHPAIRRWRPEGDRLAALEQELRWWVDVAAQDLTWARDYQGHAPQSGAPPERYLERWTEISPGLTALWGPRYRARDPDTPFVGLTASSRPISLADVPALLTVAREEFAEFAPGYLNLWTADPAGTWPGTRADSRLLAAPLAELRTRPVPGSLTVHPATDLDFYPRYIDIQERQFRADPVHRLHTRSETRETFDALRAAGTLFEVRLDGRWAGVLAGQPDIGHGLRGAVVIELLLDPAVRGRGYGPALSVLLARALPLPDDQLLFGTIHADNLPAYRAATRAGRLDVGGEVLIPLPT